MISKSLYLASAAFFALVVPSTASAHHPLAGAPMETFSHGLLSGIGHPLLGFDHLFFVIAMGIAAVYTTRRYAMPFAYIGAMLLGCFAMSIGVSLPAKEFVIAVSLVVLGAAIFRGKALGIAPAMTLFLGFGLFHGSAFGDSIAAQEVALGTEVLVGYLIGLGALQYTIAVGSGWLVSSFMKATEAEDVRVRISGAMVAGAGVFLTLESLEGMAFAALGIG